MVKFFFFFLLCSIADLWYGRIRTGISMWISISHKFCLPNSLLYYEQLLLTPKLKISFCSFFFTEAVGIYFTGGYLLPSHQNLHFLTCFKLVGKYLRLALVLGYSNSPQERFNFIFWVNKLRSAGSSFCRWCRLVDEKDVPLHLWGQKGSDSQHFSLVAYFRPWKHFKWQYHKKCSSILHWFVENLQHHKKIRMEQYQLGKQTVDRCPKSPLSYASNRNPVSNN